MDSIATTYDDRATIQDFVRPAPPDASIEGGPGTRSLAERRLQSASPVTNAK